MTGSDTALTIADAILAALDLVLTAVVVRFMQMVGNKRPKDNTPEP